MTEFREVRTQAELNKALADENVVPICVGNGVFQASGSASVQASGSASVRASGSASVRASGSASVWAYDSASVRAYDSASVRAYGSASVRAYDSASVWAFDSASVRAYGSASVRAYGSASVEAYDSASVRAYDSASVRAYGSASVWAYGSASVEAYDSASVRAYGSASVWASGSARVRASKYVPVRVQKRWDRGVTVTGGVLIEIPVPATAEEWCDFYGVRVEDGVATLFKAVRDDYRSLYGGDYTPGSTPVAQDWDGGVRECGGGLHLSPYPWMAREFDSEATRFVACPVALVDIAVHEDASMPQKVKARGCCGPVYECDRDGARLVDGVRDA